MLPAVVKVVRSVTRILNLKPAAMKPEEIKTEVFFLPAAAVAEMDGSFTNTQRLVQWHEKAVDPSGDAAAGKSAPQHHDRPHRALSGDG